MEVVDHDAARLLGDQSCHPPIGGQLEARGQLVRISKAHEPSLPAFLRQERQLRIAGQNRDGAQHQTGRLRIHVRRDVGPEQQLARNDPCRYALLVGQPVDHVAHGAVRRVGPMRRVVDPHPAESRGSGVILHLAQQSRFANPRLAAKEHRPAPPRLRRLSQEGGQASLLVVAADQWSRAPAGVADKAMLAPEAEDPDGVALSSQKTFAGRLNGDTGFGRRGGRAVQKDFVRLG